MNREIFTQVLREIRKQNKMTQDEVAEKASINEKHFGRIERGESCPTIDTVNKICKALRINESEFYKIIEIKKKKIKG